jgi:hypothetical protein
MTAPQRLLARRSAALFGQPGSVRRSIRARLRGTLRRARRTIAAAASRERGAPHGSRRRRRMAGIRAVVQRSFAETAEVPRTLWRTR